MCFRVLYNKIKDFYRRHSWNPLGLEDDPTPTGSKAHEGWQPGDFGGYNEDPPTPSEPPLISYEGLETGEGFPGCRRSPKDADIIRGRGKYKQNKEK